jgi:hypothetical protein
VVHDDRAAEGRLVSSGEPRAHGGDVGLADPDVKVSGLIGERRGSNQESECDEENGKRARVTSKHD